MKELMSRENFELWLANSPDVGIIFDHLEFLDFWQEKSKDGGAEYVKDLKKMAYDHIKERTKG